MRFGLLKTVARAGKAVGVALAAPFRPENLRSTHTYGGGLLVASGLGWAFQPAFGLVALGILLLYIGLIHTVPQRRR